ncbi:hypothetical protein FACS1894211_00240 [Clostridia bacterium]|nr:hypothetical protein FACS1894211_00240 [Clostridia bacterium]
MFDKNAKWITIGVFSELIPIVNLLDKEQTPEYYDGRERFKHREDLKNRHMLVRKEFSLDKTPENAYIDITADDYYKLYINGRFVGQGPAPSYHFHYYVNRYDISRFLKKGRNVAAVHVYYQGLINIVWPSGDYRMGMIAQISCGGVLLSTDASWKYTEAKEYVGTKVYGYLTAFTEDIDNRKKIKGWKTAGFNDADWTDAAVKERHDYRFYPQITPSLQIYEVKPAEIKTVSPGNYIFDFGGEVTGRLLVAAKGKAGDTVEISYGEEMESPEKVRGNMRCGCDYNDKWILSGEDDELDSYDYKAFRYAQINANGADIDISSVGAEVRHYPFDDTLCVFESSNCLLNQIWDICKNGVKYGTQEGYLDCPTRERGQFSGDALITAKSHAYLTGDYRIYKKAISEFALSAKICPGLMCCAPTGKRNECADYSLQFPLFLLNYFGLSGDIEFLREMLPVADGVITYFKQFSRSDGLLENIAPKQILVDWPVNYRDGYDFDFSWPNVQKGCNTVLNAFFIGAVDAVGEIKAILGAAFDCSEISELRAAFVGAFYNCDTRLFTDSDVSEHSSLHANALPLFFGLAPDTNNIVAHIKKKRLSCGVYFSYFVLKALAQAGEHDLVFELLTSEDERSWGNMIKEGATACFEAWGKGQKWNTSLCHPWASSPIIILIEDIIGIKIAAPGFKKVDFEPKIPKTLKSISIRFPTPAGEIRVECLDGKAKSNLDCIMKKCGGKHEERF